jgi:hypothetical protein
MLFLKIAKKIYSKLNNKEKKLPECIKEPITASDLIFEKLNSNKPVMIARFGATELVNVVNYLGVSDKKYINYITYIKGETPAWWWQENTMKQLQNWSGFFPPTKEKIEEFCKLMIEDSKHVDILGSWVESEKFISEFMNDTKVQLRLLEPFWSDNPWSRVLKGKKVLVVHPFKDTIEKQYEKRELLFKNKDTLPEFASLDIIRATQSLGGESNQFKDWFEALDHMKSEIDKVDYDICLIGAGAYGFPLAAHVKRTGKKAIHLGGALQLLFGIRGNRWEVPDYGICWGMSKGAYTDLMNKHWVRPNETEKPSNTNNVEGACYW